MSFSPNVPKETQTHKFAISPWSMTSDVGPFIQAAGAGTPSSTAWPLANLAMGWPFQVNERTILYQAFYATGITAGGNLDIGIYDMAGNRVQSTGTQVRVASAHTNIDWTDLVLDPGYYYAAMAADGVDLYSGWVPAAGLWECQGVVEQTTSFVLPATITWTRTTRAFCPYFGFTCHSIPL